VIWIKLWRGADVCALQVRVGGMAGRSFDEAFPLKYGVCGTKALDREGCLPLGAHGQRWSNCCNKSAARAPTALIIVLTSPVGVLVRASMQVCHANCVVGICELPWTTLLGICGSLGVAHGQIDFDYCGLNHVGWFYRLSAGSRDLIGEYAALLAKRCDFPPNDLILRYGRHPHGSIFRLHYFPEEVVQEQRERTRTRGTCSPSTPRKL